MRASGTKVSPYSRLRVKKFLTKSTFFYFIFFKWIKPIIMSTVIIVNKLQDNSPHLCAYLINHLYRRNNNYNYILPLNKYGRILHTLDDS